MAVPLASHISDKIQSKIWANEYLILGHCYKAPMQTIQSTILLFRRRHRLIISLEPAQKPKRIATIDQWLTAFQTLVAIYTVRFPHIVPALMKHSETVRDLAARNAHWHYYDEISTFYDKKHFSLGTKFIGIVDAGAPHEQNGLSSFPGIIPQKF